MKSDKIMKYAVTLVCCAVAILVTFIYHETFVKEEANRTIKVGFVYIGDTSDAYTANFVKAQTAIENNFGDKVMSYTKYNVAEDKVEKSLLELVEQGCEIIFTTSYGYGEKTKEIAEKYPDVQFCQATCNNADEEPVVSNYHTFMGRIFEGRYICGVVAGMKLKSLINEGVITENDAKIGFIAAYPYAEVISGYTAFFLGVRSVVPQATMTVKYTNSWSNYQIEKNFAEELIEDGCVIISQHSDTTGPATACEATDRSKVVYFVSYNESMRDISPTTYLAGCRIDWSPYMVEAVDAVLSKKKIEDCVDGHVNGNDIGSGFNDGWIQMLEINDFAVAEGTQKKVEELIESFEKGKIEVFKGDYIGVDPFNPSDTIDLKKGYKENDKSSAPTFHYVLKDVITVKE